MTQPPQPLSANWYSDPENPALLRWWDGTQWTERTQPRQLVQVPGPMPPVAGVGAAWRAAIERFVVKHPVWTVVGLLLVCIILTIPASALSEDVGTSIGSALWVISSIAVMVWRFAVLLKKYPDERVKARPVAKLSNSPGIVVKVLFRDLTDPVPEDHDHSYAYLWPFSELPQVGQRVVAPGMDGPAFAVITAIGASEELIREIGSGMKMITRPATDEEIEKARTKEHEDLNAWLDMMRQAAGLSTTTRRRIVPDGYPPIPPVDGVADIETADGYGRAWWRAYKNARTEEEETTFKRIGSRWYKLRDSLR